MDKEEYNQKEKDSEHFFNSVKMLLCFQKI